MPLRVISTCMLSTRASEPVLRLDLRAICPYAAKYDFTHIVVVHVRPDARRCLLQPSMLGKHSLFSISLISVPSLSWQMIENTGRNAVLFEHCAPARPPTSRAHHPPWCECSCCEKTVFCSFHRVVPSLSRQTISFHGKVAQLNRVRPLSAPARHLCGRKLSPVVERKAGLV